MSLITSFDEFVPQLRAFMTRSQEPSVPSTELDAEFNRLAAALFALQREAVPIYEKFCAKCQAPAAPDWREIPALPTSAFKEYDVTSLPPAERTRVFHSSDASPQPSSPGVSVSTFTNTQLRIWAFTTTVLISVIFKRPCAAGSRAPLPPTPPPGCCPRDRSTRRAGTQTCPA